MTSRREQSWKRGERLFFIALLLTGTLARGVYMRQVEETAVFHSYRLHHLDMNFFPQPTAAATKSHLRRSTERWPVHRKRNIE